MTAGFTAKFFHKSRQAQTSQTSIQSRATLGLDRHPLKAYYMVIIRHNCVLMLPNSLRTRTFVIYLFILRYSYSGRKTEIMAFDNEKHRSTKAHFTVLPE